TRDPGTRSAQLPPSREALRRTAVALAEANQLRELEFAMRRFVIVTAILSLSTVASNYAFDDWPQWRGQKREGTSAERGLLKDWPAGGPRPRVCPPPPRAGPARAAGGGGRSLWGGTAGGRGRRGGKSLTAADSVT